MGLDVASVEKIESSTNDRLHNVTITIKGPSRIVLLLSLLNKNMTIEMWGFDDVHLQVPNEEQLKEDKPHYFIQFIQGLQPRLIF